MPSARLPAPEARSLLRKGLVSRQVALSFLLLFGAGLFVRSLQNLKATNTGFKEIDTIVKFRVAPALNGYQTERVVQFYTDLLANIRALPGVKAAGYAVEFSFSREARRTATCRSKAIRRRMAKTCRLT